MPRDRCATLARDEFEQLLREAERWGLDDQMQVRAFVELALAVAR